MTRILLLAALVGGLSGPAAAAGGPRQALAMKAEVNGGTATVTVAFNYVGKTGDPPKFTGVRLYRYDLAVGKGPTRVGWDGKGGRQAVVLAGKRYTYVPAGQDRQENGMLAVTAAPGGKVRLTGVYHYDGVLFVVDEAVRPGTPVLLEAGGKRPK